MARPGPDFTIDLEGTIRPKRMAHERDAERQIEAEIMARAVEKAKARIRKRRLPWWRRWL